MFGWFEKLGTPYKLGFILIVFLVGSYTGAYVRGVFYDAAQKEQLEQDLAAEKQKSLNLFNSSGKLQKELADLRGKKEETEEKVVYEIQKIPVYRECVLPDSGVQIINDAINARPVR